MATQAETPDRFEQAIERLSDPARFREAERLVARSAPQLQRVLASILETGDWFGEAHLEELRKAMALEDGGERESALRTLIAEESRIAMMVGVAVGWALADEMGTGQDTNGED